MIEEERKAITHRPNSFQTPNHIIDQLLDRLTGNEFKVVMYIMRLTYGFHRRSVSFSQRELEEGRSISGKLVDHGVGISRRRVRESINGLVAKKLLKVTPGDRAKGQSDTYELVDPLPSRDDLEQVEEDLVVENPGTQRPDPRDATSRRPRDATSLPPGTQRPHNRNTDLRNTEDEIHFSKANARAREEALKSKAPPTNSEEPLVELTEYQIEQVKLSYVRELPKEKVEWALQRGVELLEAWLVKRDPNTNRMNAESVQKAHHDRLMKGWVLRELKNEISSQRGAQGRRNGKSNESYPSINDHEGQMRALLRNAGLTQEELLDITNI